MTLINCPECDKEISDKAASCPQCGNPMEEENVQTIQHTAKNLKGNQALGAILAIIGTVMLVGGITEIGTIVTVVGIAWFIMARLMTWWHHE